MLLVVLIFWEDFHWIDLCLLGQLGELLERSELLAVRRSLIISVDTFMSLGTNPLRNIGIKLWLIGLLAALDSILNGAHPLALFSRMPSFLAGTAKVLQRLGIGRLGRQSILGVVGPLSQTQSLFCIWLVVHYGLIKSLFLTSTLIKLGMRRSFRFKFGLEGMILVVFAQWALCLATFAADVRWVSGSWSSLHGIIVLANNCGDLTWHLIQFLSWADHLWRKTGLQRVHNIRSIRCGFTFPI